MDHHLIDRPVTTGPGQISPTELVAPFYRAAIAAANAQLDKLPQLREEGRITDMAYAMVDAELVANINFLSNVLGSYGEPQPQPIR